MGIPHLIGTLEPYATHKFIDNSKVIIDGPSFAYHVLYVCRLNGVVQPGYEQLAQVAIGWLDELQRHGISMYDTYSHLPIKFQLYANSVQRGNLL